jgi:hypothetical protein
VEPLLSVVIRYLPKPSFFYRMNTVKITPRGREALTVDLTNGLPPEKEIVLNDGDIIALDAVPADDPALQKRVREGIFVGRPEEGFLREVYHVADEATRKALAANGPIIDEAWVQTFHAQSECVLPDINYAERKFSHASGNDVPPDSPWGGTLELFKSKKDFTKEPQPAPPPGFAGSNQKSGIGSPAVTAVTLHIDKGDSVLPEINIPYRFYSFSSTPDGWIEFLHPQIKGVTCLMLPEVVEYLRAGRIAGTKWQLRNERNGSALAEFVPGKDPIPAIPVRKGDWITTGKEDAGMFSPPPPSGNPPPRRRVVLPTQQ